MFVKIDTTGYGRAGLPATDSSLGTLLTAIFAVEAAGLCNVVGLYSHAGNSYGGNNTQTALGLLTREISGLFTTSEYLLAHPANKKQARDLVLSVGATPTVVSLQNLAHGSPYLESDTAVELMSTIGSVRDSGHLHIELHADVYTLLD